MVDDSQDLESEQKEGKVHEPYLYPSKLSTQQQQNQS